MSRPKLLALLYVAVAVAPALAVEPPPLAIAIHGGAGVIDAAKMTPQRAASFRAGLAAALDAGYAILEHGGSSLDAVTAAVRIMEDDPQFNAGRGAVLNHEGDAELDAAIMDGHGPRAGAVAGVRHVRNPVELARLVMEKSPHVLLVAEGAEEFALEQGVYSFNVESEAELEYIDKIAGAKNLRAPVALRANPDIDPHTHEYISTGSRENKFGIALGRLPAVYERAAKMRNIDIVGVQMHIGSQITEAAPFADAVTKVAPIVRDLKTKYGIKFFSIGGGLGIVYESSFESGVKEWWSVERNRRARRGTMPLSIQQYVDAILSALGGLRDLKLRILLEPGRLLVGNAGVLLTRVRYIKHTGEKKFAIVDAGMNDLIRPALYHSYHEIVPAQEPICRASAAADAKPLEKIDIVGPVCESGDFFALDREMPEICEGDLLAIMSAGAYGFVMASNYNSRPLPGEALVRGDKFALIRKRQTNKDLIRGEFDAAL